jgi:hypothetical protein
MSREDDQKRTADAKPQAAKKAGKPSREERLAAALRDNLKRRKQQARARKS